MWEYLETVLQNTFREHIVYTLNSLKQLVKIAISTRQPCQINFPCTLPKLMSLQGHVFHDGELNVIVHRSIQVIKYVTFVNIYQLNERATFTGDGDKPPAFP